MCTFNETGVDNQHLELCNQRRKKREKYFGKWGLHFLYDEKMLITKQGLYTQNKVLVFYHEALLREGYETTLFPRGECNTLPFCL